MDNNYVLTVRSIDKIGTGDTTGSFTVALPPIPQGAYKATVSTIISGLSSSADYTIEIKGMTRSVTSVKVASPMTTDGYNTACVVQGKTFCTGTFYLDYVPDRLAVRCRSANSATVTDVTGNWVMQLHLERIK